MMISITVTAGSKTGPVIDEWSDAEGIVFRSGEHGHWSFECTVIMGQIAALEFYEQGFDLFITISYGGIEVWTGRIEDIGVTPNGLTVVAFGLWSVFNDLLYTALWVDGSYENYESLNGDYNAVYNDERFELDNNNRLKIVPRKDESFDTGVKGGYAYETPSNSDRQIVRVMFDYEFKASADWIAKCRTAGATWASGSGGEWTLTGNGTLQTGTASLDWSSYATDRLVFFMYYDNGTPADYTGETGDYYLKITGVSLRTIDQVTDIAGEEIVKGLLAYVAGINDSISTDETLIESPGDDIDLYVAEDARPGTLLDQLAAGGNDETPPAYFEAGVWGNRLHFRRVAGVDCTGDDCGDHKVWYASISGFDTERSISDLVNSAYGTYGNSRTDRATDADSIAIFGFTKEESISADTESETRAERHRDALLADQKTIEPRAAFLIDQVVGEGGAEADYWEVRAGDIMHLVNLPPNFRELDRVRSFRIRTAEYDPGADVLVLTPLELPSLELIATGG